MPEITTVAVIGAGGLGRSIACATARAGYRTILEDILPASLRRADREIRDFLDELVKSGTISPQDLEATLSRLEYAGSVEEAARQADLVIEAVPDEMESKLEIFTLLDKIAKPHTILATTTRTFRVSDIASVTYREGKSLGMHLSDVAVGLVRTCKTDDETLAACIEVGVRLGKKTIVIEDKSLV